MAKTIQLTVSCKNRPGTLARLARALGDAKVNIRAFQAETLGAAGRVRLIVNNPKKARKALKAAGFSCFEQAVLVTNLADKPGALGAFAGKLAAQKVNITAAYGSASKSAKRPSIVFAVSNVGKAGKVR